MGTDEEPIVVRNRAKVDVMRKRAKVDVIMKQLLIKTKATGKYQSAVAFTSGCPQSHMVMGRNTCSAAAVQCSVVQSSAV